MCCHYVILLLYSNLFVFIHFIYSTYNMLYTIIMCNNRGSECIIKLNNNNNNIKYVQFIIQTLK